MNAIYFAVEGPRGDSEAFVYDLSKKRFYQIGSSAVHFAGDIGLTNLSYEVNGPRRFFLIRSLAGQRITNMVDLSTLEAMERIKQ